MNLKFSYQKLNLMLLVLVTFIVTSLKVRLNDG